MHGIANKLLWSVVWALIMPVTGYCLFTMLTILPAFGLMMGHRLLIIIYWAGFLPSLVTAILWHFVFCRWNCRMGVSVTCVTGCLTAAAWYEVMTPNPLFGFDYFTAALFAATIGATVIMPLVQIGLRKQRDPASA